MHIGFIGLGQMGRGMAARLAAAGHELTLWNRSPIEVASLGASGARVADHPRATLDCDITLSMLADDAAVQSVWIDAGLAQEALSGVTHVNMATVSLAMSRRLSALHRARGAAYVAAPVFGRPEFAARGELDIVAAGPAEALERCRPVFETLGRRCFVVGAEAHHASIVKIARNLVLATIIESLGEAFALTRGAGVPARRFLDIITSTSMNAPAYKNYGRLMLEQPVDPSFPLRLGLKDVELALAAAADLGLSLRNAQLIREQHLAAIAHGYGDRDWAELGNWIAAAAELTA
jgi:3-hydroxyisobutyrate dehydrogenase-like beta-hydroxyacid dehydrogenase